MSKPMVLRPSYVELEAALKAATAALYAAKATVPMQAASDVLDRCHGEPLMLYVSRDDDDGSMQVIVPDSLPEVEIVFLDLHSHDDRTVATYNQLLVDPQFEVHDL